ncbi:FadR/GntR family transcriptional regulator [uncultured Cohaesibacter sp.]|uniref:FadR/GntR family transcriptional regulator n=1 Tax=uncultured Cohaesibacter sp. TaxID=1002546 RepID=UPI0029C76FD1|nr:FadR/GntR family transcriptional regulator [uncultured Cohaesibacter sp.]
MRQSLTDEVTASIMEQINSGQITAGEKLPTGAQLAAEYGVSLTVIREAISRLQSEGLVMSRQGAGVFVSKSTVRRPFRINAGDDRMSIAKIFELRTGAEIEAAGLAALRHTKRDLNAIARSLKNMEGAIATGTDAVTEDLEFHRAIASATKNTLFCDFVEFLEGHIRGAIETSRSVSTDTEVVLALEEHKQIFEAISNGDAAAAQQAMKLHMLNCLERCRECD